MGYDATGGKPYKAQQDGPLWYVIVGAVVALSFGVVFFGPKLFGGGGANKDSIAKLVSGRTVPEAAGLINAYGFEDEATLAFLSTLQRKDPVEHAELLTDMAKAALKGADRSGLGAVMFEWTQSYLAGNSEVLAYADAASVDTLIAITGETLTRLETVDATACGLGKLARISANPDLMSGYMHHGGPLYDISMQSNTVLVNMVHSAKANAAGAVEEVATTDPADLERIMADLKASPELEAAFNGDLFNVDVCAAGKRVVSTIQSQPEDVRLAMWGALVSGELFQTEAAEDEVADETGAATAG